MQIGDIVKHLRVTKMLTQEELAQALGISASYLSLLENGKRPATKRILRCLASHLDVPAGYLVLHELSLTELAPRHRSVVKAMRRELVKPAFDRVFARRRKGAPAAPDLESAAAPSPAPAPDLEPAGEQTPQPSQ